MPPPRSLAKPALVALLALAGGCSRDEPPPQPAQPAPAVSVPVDRLAEGEDEESSERAFELPVPKGMSIRSRGPREVTAEGRVSFEWVSNYVRKRIKADTIELGAARTVFQRAKMRDESSERVVEVEVINFKPYTRLIVRDLAPPRVDPMLTPEERWKQHGLTPEGTIIDPKTLE